MNDSPRTDPPYVSSPSWMATLSDWRRPMLAVASLCGLALFAVEGPCVAFAAHFVLCLFLACAAAVDLRTFIIPNALVAMILVEWIAYAIYLAFYLPFHAWAMLCEECLLAAVAVGGGLLLFAVLYGAAAKRPSLGGGDVKLLFAVSLFLGVEGSALNLLLACGLSIPLALLWSRWGQRWQESARVPFAAKLGTSREQSSEQEQPSEQERSTFFEPELAASREEPFRHQPFPFGPAICAATFISLLLGFAAV